MDVTLTLTPTGRRWERWRWSARRARLASPAKAYQSTRWGSVSSAGQYKGSLAVSLADALILAFASGVVEYRLAAATAFAGSPGTITGRLSGRVDLTGSGTDFSEDRRRHLEALPVCDTQRRHRQEPGSGADGRSLPLPCAPTPSRCSGRGRRTTSISHKARRDARHRKRLGPRPTICCSSRRMSR